jgi:AmiR/NasT family two-component response regulator
MTALIADAVPPARRPELQGAPAAGDRVMAWSRAMAASRRARWLIAQSQELRALAQTLARASAESRQARVRSQHARLRSEALQRSEYQRLRARLETQPVIEQAKGILMAQSGYSDAEAFDLLRRASQRSNVPVRELAAQLVAKAVRDAQATRKAG